MSCCETTDKKHRDGRRGGKLTFNVICPHVIVDKPFSGTAHDFSKAAVESSLPSAGGAEGIMSIFKSLYRVAETGIQQDLLSKTCQFSTCFSETWTFLSCFHWIRDVILSRDLNQTQSLRVVGGEEHSCAVFFSPLCSVWRLFGFLSIFFGACNQVWRSVLKHQPRRCCQNCCRYFLKSVF